MTLALAETIRLQQHSARVTRLVHRNQAPMFCGQRARVHLRATPDGHSVELSTPDGPRTRIDVESQLDGTAHA
jgi:3-methylfumaryl-CoA hydratase